MLDSRWIPALLAAGWLSLTLGIWGATGEHWWIWPLSMGAASCVAGFAYAWAAVRQARAAKRPDHAGQPYDPPRQHVGATLP